jgi:hypothetical protein
MEIFWRLVLAHLIADFTLQTNYIAAWKRKSLIGISVHCAIHPIISALLTWRYLGQTWLQIGSWEITGCTSIAIIFITHFIEDEWRVWTVLKKWAPDNILFYLWDQMIHYTVILMVSPAIAGSPTYFKWFQYPALNQVVPAAEALGLSLWERFMTVTYPEPWVCIAILIAIVTHFTTINIYFIEKDWFGIPFPSTAEKYLSMAERLAVMGCFFLPGHWWIVVVLFWLLRTAVYKIRKIQDFTWTNIIIGNTTAVTCGILSRSILYP